MNLTGIGRQGRSLEVGLNNLRSDSGLPHSRRAVLVQTVTPAHGTLPSDRAAFLANFLQDFAQ